MRALTLPTRLTAALLALVLAAAGWLAWHPAHRDRPAATPRITAPAALPVAPPGAPPVDEVALKPVSAKTAIEINAAVPLLSAGPAAAPFVLDKASPAWDRAETCLAQAIYYEAGFEPTDGKRAVAQVILNRVRSPAFPNTVCGVVYQGSQRPTGCQFTFTCDGALSRAANERAFASAREVAAAALRGYVFAPVGHATHYHANYVVPYWASSMAKVRVIGQHDFYRWAGNWKPATYFSQAYAFAEPDIRGLPRAAPTALAEVAPAPSPVPVAKNGLIPSDGPLAAGRAAAKAALVADAGPNGDGGDGDEAPTPQSSNRMLSLSAALRSGKLKQDAPK